MLAEEDRQLVYGRTVDIRSAFGELFQAENSGELELFRSCGEAATGLNRAHTQPPRRWLSVSEAAWMQVEKRLRSIVRRAVLGQPELKEYMQALELVVVFVSSTGQLPPPHIIPAALGNMLEGALELHVAQRDKCSLTIPLKDSAFHRLLLHTVSQFYGLRSQSSSKSTSKKDKRRRATVVTFPAKTSPALQSRASVWGFLKHGADSESVAETDAETETESSEIE